MELRGKKIGFLTRRFGGGGAERVSVLLANNFARRGLNVSILAIDGQDDSYALDPRVKVFLLNKENVGAVGKVKRLVGVWSFLKDNDIEIAVALGGPVFYLSALRNVLRCELVVSERNWPPSIYDKRRLRAINRLYRKSSKVVFQTEAARDCFDETVQSKAAVIPNPVMDGLPEACCANAKKKIVAVGRLDKQKNYPLLINAFALFAENGHEDYELIIFGQGGQKQALMDLVAGSGLEGKVTFAGFSDTVHESICDVEIFVSSSDYEGLQNSLIEAMAIGIPCIATDCLGGGARLITNSGSRALLVPRGNVEALADAMARLAEDAELRCALSSEGKRLRKEWSTTAICNQWFDYIERD